MKVNRNKLALICVLLGSVLLVCFLMYEKIHKQRAPGIVQAPDHRLRMVSEIVKIDDDDIDTIKQELLSVMQALDTRWNVFGLGMAANQIGYNKRVIALKDGYGEYRIMINPEIIERKWTVPILSTCFSLNGLHFADRALWITVGYQDSSGEYHEEVFTGGQATVFQQEVDHLNGILVSD